MCRHVYTYVEPQMLISIAHIFPLAKKFVQENDTTIHRIQSEDPSNREGSPLIYVKSRTKAEELKVSKKAFPSQITFSIWYEPMEKYFMVKLSVHSQIHIPGVCNRDQSDAIPCIEELIKCLKYCYENENITYNELKCHMSNYKMNLNNRYFSLHHIKKALVECDAGKIRLSPLHIYTFIKEKDRTRDMLEDIVTKTFLPCKLFINYDSLIKVMDELRCDLVYDTIVNINIIFTDIKTANTFIHIYINSILEKVLKKLDSNNDNCIVLHHMKHEKEGCYIIIFRYISADDSDITVQVFASGKININSCLNYRITSRIRDWFIDLMARYPKICF